MKNEIENIFKEKFDSFEAAPSAGLFDAIIAKRAKKKRAIWIWSAATLVLIGASFSIYHTTAPRIATVDTIAKEEVTNTDESKTLQELPEVSTSNQNNDLIKEPLLLDSNTKNVSVGTTPQIRKVVAKAGNQPPLIQKKPTIYTPPYSESTSPSNKAPDNKIEQNHQFVNKEFAALFDKLAEADKSVDRSKGRLFLGNLKKEVTSDYTLPTREPIGKPDRNILPDTDVPAQSPQNETGNEPESTTGDLPIRKLSPLNRWSIETSIGLGAGKGIISSNDQAYEAMRNTSDKTRISSAINVRGIYRINPKWDIQAGIVYTVRNEVFNITEPDYWKYSNREEERTRTVIHPVLGSIEEQYTVTVVDSSLQKGTTLNSSNNYNSISIPLSLERIIILNPKWTMLAKGGISAGLKSTAAGEILATNDATELSNIPARNGGVHGAHLGIGVMYQANKRISLIAYPTGSFDLRSRMNNDAIFEQRDLSIYTHLGVRINL
jgi:hypothetical protein